MNCSMYDEFQTLGADVESLWNSKNTWCFEGNFMKFEVETPGKLSFCRFI